METRELVREVPGDGRRGRSGERRVNVERRRKRMRMRRRWREGGREGGLRERRVEADTLGNLYNYPQGRPEAVDGQEGGRGWLSVEKAGAHTSIQGTTPRPGLLRHLSELLPPVHHLALAPSCHPTCHPSPSHCLLFHGQLSACLQCFLC